MSLKMSMEQKKRFVGLIFIIPWLFGFISFFLIPIMQTLVFSFHNVEINPYALQGVGLENYREALFSDPDFPVKLMNAVLTLIPDLFMVLVFSFFMAVIINQKFRGNGIVKLIFFLTVILASGTFMALQSQSGDINSAQLNNVVSESSTASGLLQKIEIEQYLTELGIPQTILDFLVAPMQRLFSILMKSGVQIFIFLAALKSIPGSLYEACHIEGATAWEAFWKITIPMLSPMLLVNIVYTIIDSFMANDNECLIYIRRVVFYDQRFGIGSAMSWLYFAVIAVILALSVGIISKRVFYNE